MHTSAFLLYLFILQSNPKVWLSAERIVLKVTPSAKLIARPCPSIGQQT